MAAGLGTLTVWLKAPTSELRSNLGDAKGAIVAFSRTSDAAISAFASESSAKLLGLRDSAVDVAFNIKAIQQAGVGVFGTLAAGAGAVGVAIAGWEIGKKIAEVTELSDKFADFFFNAGNKEFEGKLLDQKLAAMGPRGTKTKEAEDAKKASDAARDEEVKKMPGLLDDIAEIQRRNDEKRMSNQELYNSLVKRQESNTLEFQNLSYVKNPQKYLEAKKQELELASRIADVEARINEENAQRLENNVTGFFDRANANVKKTEPMRTESSIVSAVQKGSLEALRIENSRTTKDPVAENTKATAEGVQAMVRYMQKLQSGGTVMEAIAAL